MELLEKDNILALKNVQDGNVVSVKIHTFVGYEEYGACYQGFVDNGKRSFCIFLHEYCPSNCEMMRADDGSVLVSDSTGRHFIKQMKAFIEFEGQFKFSMGVYGGNGTRYIIELAS